MVTEFGKFCRKLRIDNNEIMKDMAKKLGVTVSHLSAVEIGKRKIPFTWAEEISKHYELTALQVTELTILIVLNSLSPREKEALSHAAVVLYLNDRSDYLNGLWNVVRTLIGENIVENEGFNIRDLAQLLGAID